MFPEFKWSKESKWTLTTAAKTSLESWRSSLFATYEKQLKTTPPDCLAALGRMLWQGPITKLFGRANETMFPMPVDEQDQWKLVNSSGKTTYLPRQIFALRQWNPTTRSYDVYDSHLEGAPKNSEKEEWFRDAIRHLKSYFGGKLAPDAHFLAMNEKDLLCQTFLDSINVGGTNKWTDIVMTTKGTHA